MAKESSNLVRGFQPIDPSVIKQKVASSLLDVRSQFEAREADVVESVMAEVLPGYMDELKRTSPERIAKLLSQKVEEQTGIALSEVFSGWDSLAAEINSEIPALLAA